MYPFTNLQRKKMRDAVLRGAELLDKRHPRWFKKIDLDHFDLSQNSYCICGQLDSLWKGTGAASGWGDWQNAFRRLLGRESGNYDKSGAHYGFVALCVNDGIYSGERHWAEWAFMENIWRLEIKRRRRAAAKK